MDLLDYQYLKIDFVDKPLVSFGTDYPLDLYCSYTFDQILVALGKHTEQKRIHFREGALYFTEKNLDVFFVTLIREYKKEATFASPFTCIGFADFQSHYGSASISIVWKMKGSLPGFVMKKTV